MIGTSCIGGFADAAPIRRHFTHTIQKSKIMKRTNMGLVRMHHALNCTFEFVRSPGKPMARAAVHSIALSVILFVSSFVLGKAMQQFYLPFRRVSSRALMGQVGKYKGITNALNHHCSNARRLFGSKRGVAGNPLGTVAIYNDQQAIPNIDESALQETVQKIARILGYETYDVTLLLVDDEEMAETNLESRGVNSPTDILSFPFLEAVEPGLLKEPEFDVPDYYTLGDMMVDVPYVIRRCQEDMEDEIDSEEEDDRGVSGAMAKVSDPEKRIHMLLVHGMLHLVGHDHEEDEEYEKMVQREEEILKTLGLLK
jgi:probable rRNA maturation factor